MQAEPVQDAFAVTPQTTPDGVNWLVVKADPDIYDHFKRLPQVVRCDGRVYVLTSHNSDTMEIIYKEASKKGVAIPK